MPTILIDKKDYRNQRIDRNSVIAELGDSLELDSSCYDSSGLGLDENALIQWINRDYNLSRWGHDEIRHEYVKAHTCHTYKENNDIAGEIEFTIYCQEGFNDAFWSRDSYVEVDGCLYFIDSGGVADTDFFQWRVGWHLLPFRDPKEDPALETISNKLSAGYSCNPTYELDEVLHTGSSPVWSEKRGCFVGRVKSIPYAVEIHPSLY